MTSVTYPGVVVYDPNPEPYPTERGPKHSIKIRMLEPDALDISARSKLKEGDVAVLWREPDKPIINYLLSLRKGDMVDLIWMDVGRGLWAWRFPQEVGQQSYSPAPVNRPALPRPAPYQQPLPSGPRKWKPITPAENDALFSIGTSYSELQLTFMAAIASDERWNALGLSTEDVRQIATAACIQAFKFWSPGMELVSEEEATSLSRDQEILSVDPTPATFVNDLLQKIADLSEVVTDRAGVTNTLRTIGVGAGDIRKEDKNSWLRVAHILWRYEELVKEGTAEDKAVLIVANEFSIPVF